MHKDILSGEVTGGDMFKMQPSPMLNILVEFHSTFFHCLSKFNNNKHLIMAKTQSSENYFILLLKAMWCFSAWKM